jgi:hypothetical protein
MLAQLRRRQVDVHPDVLQNIIAFEALMTERMHHAAGPQGQT